MGGRRCQPGLWPQGVSPANILCVTLCSMPFRFPGPWLCLATVQAIIKTIEHNTHQAPSCERPCCHLGFLVQAVIKD